MPYTFPGTGALAAVEWQHGDLALLRGWWPKIASHHAHPHWRKFNRIALCEWWSRAVRDRAGINHDPRGACGDWGPMSISSGICAVSEIGPSGGRQPMHPAKRAHSAFFIGRVWCADFYLSGRAGRALAAWKPPLPRWTMNHNLHARHPENPRRRGGQSTPLNRRVEPKRSATLLLLRPASGSRRSCPF